MPYSSNSDLPAAVRSRYSGKCQDAFRATWNGEYADHGDEQRAFATAHAAAKRCQEANKAMDVLNRPVDFKIFSGQFAPVDKGDGKLRLRTIASSSVEDLSGDIVTPKALRAMANSAKGMTIFRNHSYKVPGDILGTVEEAFVQQTKEFDDEGKPIHELVMDVAVFADNPENVRTHKAAEEGVMLGTSIGAMIPPGGARKNSAGGYTFEDLRLKEASIVGIPQNPRSWVQYATKAVKSAEAEPDESEDTNEAFTKAADETDVEKARVWVTHDAKSQTVTVDTDAPAEPDAADKGESKEKGEKATKKDVEPEVEKTLEPRTLAPGEKLEEGDLSLAVGAIPVSKADETMDADLELLKDMDIDWENLPEGDQAVADALYAEYDLIETQEKLGAYDPEVTKAPLSSAARSNLSESQFACPEKRKYPIHDKAHIRAALSRCGDPSNDQCGCSKVKAAARKAGIGDSEKATEPLDLVKEATVVTATLDETPPAQELGESVPESAGTAVKSGDDMLHDTVSRSAGILADVVKAQNSEILSLRASLKSVSEERDTLKAALPDLMANYKLASEIVQKLAKTPLGRKAVFAEGATDFADLEAKFGSIYSPTILKMLEK
jgi:cation transport regulator ChaB